MKKILTLALILASSTSLMAQEGAFWTFDDNQDPSLIPSECDGHCEEIRGGVFNPTVSELYEYGVAFLSSDDLTVKQQGAYCILSAALQGHAQSQFILAQLYEKGNVLPQDDLSAYKWSFMAALGGEKEAERYTLTLEQFLTTDELERTNGAIQETRMKVQENIQKLMDEQKQSIDKEREELTRLAQEIQSYGGQLKLQQPVNKNPVPTMEEVRSTMPSLLNVFSERDRME